MDEMAPDFELKECVWHMILQVRQRDVLHGAECPVGSFVPLCAIFELTSISFRLLGLL